jgi:DNA polymerase-1
MKRIVLIDADIDLYQITQKHQLEVQWDSDTITMSCDIESAKQVFDATVKGIVDKLEADDYILCLTGDKNFRKTHFPEYKSNRKETRKPIGYSVLKQYAMDNHNYKIYDELEADDVMGIMATKLTSGDTEFVIHSMDKDLKTIPALIWDRHSNKVVRTSELEANRFLYTQILTGDICDGYKGCPKVGKVKAQQALANCTNEFQMRQAVYNLYFKAYKDDDIAMKMMKEQAGQARILRSSDFDFKTKSVIIWNPWRNDNGNIETESKVQESSRLNGERGDSLQSPDQQ